MIGPCFFSLSLSLVSYIPVGKVEEERPREEASIIGERERISFEIRRVALDLEFMRFLEKMQ